MAGRIILLDAYGGEVITGWVTRFYPYLQVDGMADVPNPLLELRVGEPRNMRTDGDHTGAGISSRQVPATLSKVVVNVNDQTAGDNRVVALQAGLIGVAQDDDGALRPVAGWCLTNAEIQLDELLDRIARDHETTPPRQGLVPDGPADLIALYRRFGSASLFGGAWRLLSFDQHRQAGWVTVIFDLADGRSIGYMGSDEDVEWVALREGEDEPMLPVYGTSLAMLLNTALDSDGEFEHLRTRQRPQLFF
ncbi:DUF4419 domain-containing protein [Actinocrispum sp. NPDC049592]|uniref:DUF4419 domain-containing protein n=1 Tax=Actinocrispum sp. NPDC049592 TaxID=3154835 RepID=UPI00344391B2